MSEVRSKKRKGEVLESDAVKREKEDDLLIGREMRFEFVTTRRYLETHCWWHDLEAQPSQLTDQVLDRLKEHTRSLLRVQYGALVLELGILSGSGPLRHFLRLHSGEARDLLAASTNADTLEFKPVVADERVAGVVVRVQFRKEKAVAVASAAASAVRDDNETESEGEAEEKKKDPWAVDLASPDENIGGEPAWYLRLEPLPWAADKEEHASHNYYQPIIDELGFKRLLQVVSNPASLGGVFQKKVAEIIAARRKAVGVPEVEMWPTDLDGPPFTLDQIREMRGSAAPTAAKTTLDNMLNGNGERVTLPHRLFHSGQRYTMQEYLVPDSKYRGAHLWPGERLLKRLRDAGFCSVD